MCVNILLSIHIRKRKYTVNHLLKPFIEYDKNWFYEVLDLRSNQFCDKKVTIAQF